MTGLLKKLNYKKQERIAILNAREDFVKDIADSLEDVAIDTVIDQRYPYEFMIVFVNSAVNVSQVTPAVLHNLTADGILWFCFPGKKSKNQTPDLTRDRGWDALTSSGFHGVRLVSVNNEFSALKFRNIKYIKSASGRN
jgi:hypothetical protein